MIRFEIFFNNLENSSRLFYLKKDKEEIHITIFNAVYYIFEQDKETATNCAKWAESAIDCDEWENNDITIICRCENIF